MCKINEEDDYKQKVQNINPLTFRSPKWALSHVFNTLLWGFQNFHGLYASNPSLPRTPTKKNLMLLQCKLKLTMII
jgi:hypothetical protein